MTVGRTLLIAQAQADVIRTKLNTASATIKGYNGTRPATADTALSGNTLLWTITMTAGLFTTAAAIDGTFSNSSALPDSTAVIAAGPYTCTFIRAADSTAVTMFDDDTADSASIPGTGAFGITGGTSLATGTKISTASGAFTYRG